MRPPPHWIETGVALTLLFLLVGCPAWRAATPPDSLPAVGSGVERVGAHIESAERLNKAAKPVAGDRARPLLDAQSEEHSAAAVALGDTRKALAQSTKEREQLAEANVELARENQTIKAGWGYRLQLLVKRLLVTLAVVAGLHFVAGIAALFVPGVGGAMLAKVALLLNPFAWFQSARDNYYFRVKAPAQGSTVTV